MRVLSKVYMQTIEPKQLWKEALNEIEMNVSPANFSTWFKQTHIIKEEDGVIYLGVQNTFVKEWLMVKYNKLILKSIRNSFEGVRNVEYIITKDVPSGEANVQKIEPVLTNEQFPLHDLYINKEDNLNPRYTFDSFIVGSFNDLAYAASQAVINKPGVAHNPFVVYGQTGLGKTHLIQSTGNQLKKNGAMVFYTSSEKFSLDYASSVLNNQRHAFKEKYRKYDVFIMDDIQFLSKKEGTQEELFHLFNELYENNKQIIFSSDKHHNYIPNVEDRLKTRFSQGITVDIAQPDYESRLMILNTKLKAYSIAVPDDILDYIATNITGSIRELEGILNTISCHAELHKKPLQISDIKEIVRSNARPKKTLDIKEVTKIVSDFYHLDDGVIYKKTRRKEIVKPRQILMYLLREDFGTSFPLIGQKLGGRDHTTVIHACEKIKNDIKKDSVLVQELEQLRTML